MAGGGGKQQEGGANSEWTYIIFVALVVLVCWATWNYASPAVIYPAYASNWVQIKAIEGLRWISGGELREGGLAVRDAVQGVFDGRRDPKTEVYWQEFWSVRTLVGAQTRWFFVAAISTLAVLVAFRMRGAGFKRNFSLAGGKDEKGKERGPSLALYAAQKWKVTAVSASFDPDGKDSNIKPARTPLEWLRDNGCRYEDSILDRDACEELFRSQLGQPWHGVRRAHPHVQAVLVLAALHLMRHPKALAARAQVNQGWALARDRDGTEAGKSAVAPFLADERIVAGIDRICGKHAYANTAVFAMIDRARAKGGVLASADFLWLRRCDRSLWYTVNNVGRKRFHIEAAGAVGHFFAERVTGSALPEPHIDTCVDGVEDYLADQGIYSIELFFKKPDDDF